jgi:threonine synthase
LVFPLFTHIPSPPLHSHHPCPLAPRADYASERAEILRAQEEIIRLGGIFVEPACAAPIAGLRNLIASGRVDGSGRIVAVMTGFGLKDPETASRLIGEIREADATLVGVRTALGW